MLFIQNIFLILLIFVQCILANTETFVLNLRNREQISNLELNEFDYDYYYNNDRIYKYELTNDLIDITNAYKIDISNLQNFNDSIYLFYDVTNLNDLNYFVRVCWSAIHPISIDLSINSMDNSTIDYFIVKITTDYYNADEHSSKATELLKDTIIQLTLNENTFLFDSVSKDMIKLGGYVVSVAIFAVLLSSYLII